MFIVIVVMLSATIKSIIMSVIMLNVVAHYFSLIDHLLTIKADNPIRARNVSILIFYFPFIWEIPTDGLYHENIFYDCKWWS
jgi:hypothetical protein